jgi:hypothetical protein
MRHAIALSAALLLGGCATTTYQLAVMPRDSGKIYPGIAENASGAEGPISIAIEGREYRGTWVQTVPSYTTGYSTGFGWGWGRGWHYPYAGVGGSISMDNPQGGEVKALLTAQDGSGLRCDFRGGPALRGGGSCRDDKGMTYDVQIRPAPAPTAPKQ